MMKPLPIITAIVALLSGGSAAAGGDVLVRRLETAADYADIDSESRYLAAHLLLMAHDPGREREMFEALRIYADDYAFSLPLIETIGSSDTEKLVVESAMDETLPAQVRSYVMHPLQLAADPSAGLVPELEQVLAEVARTADDYYVIQKAGETSTIAYPPPRCGCPVE